MDVLPSAASLSASFSRSAVAILASSRSRRLPTSSFLPSTDTLIPFPVTDSNSPGSVSFIPLSSAPCTIACPSGCSEERSAEATSRSNSSALLPLVGTTSVSEGCPFVIVPVLSSTRVLSLCAVSRASAERMRIPFWAPLPVPTMMESGVARPRAHGQAIMSTATAFTRAKMRAGVGPKLNQTMKVAMAMKMTMGTKRLAIRSARRWMGALEPWACSTNWIIWASMVSFPTLLALKRKAPVWLMVAPITVSPSPFVTGRLSPVTIDSSNVERPSIISPSTGTFSPGRTITISPSCTCSIGISSSLPSRNTRAVFAWRPMSLRMASPVPPLAIASRRRPSIMRVMMTPTAS